MFSTKRYLDEYVQVLQKLDDQSIERMARALLGAWKTGGTVFGCGNGGSAASACHFIADLTKLTAPARGRRLRALALTESMSAVSAIANDIAYSEIFVEQLKPFLTPRDVVIGFSTSGSSPNVIRAIEYANAVGATTIGVTGLKGMLLHALAGQTLVVPSTSVQQVEDATMVAAHLLCLRVKDLIARQTLEMTLHPVVVPMNEAASTERHAEAPAQSEAVAAAGAPGT
jgi:D-sedoheptulose 7-phosphate isomerase